MTNNAETPQRHTGGSQEVSAASGSTALTVPQQRGRAQQPDGLFPAADGKPVARPLILVTRGRVEYLAHCPECADWHRHVHLGDVTGPCGTEYELRSRRGRGA
jgi:hypothetical protein